MAKKKSKAKKAIATGGKKAAKKVIRRDTKKPVRLPAKKRGAKKVVAKRAASRQPVKPGGVSEKAVIAKTGHGWDHWLSVLDAFDVKKNGHRAASEHLHKKHGVSEWWSQMVAVGYEQKRGLRELRQKADGYSASASRTIVAPMAAVLDAFEDKGLASRWLPEGVVAHKVTRPPMKDGRPTKAGSARMTWTDGSKTLSVWISDKAAKNGPAKTAVQVQHDKLPDARTCDRMRAMWAERMDALREMLENAQ